MSKISIDMSLLKYYVKLRHHRCGIVEGVRSLATRNSGLIFRVGDAPGMSDFSGKEARIAFENKMLDDLGQEPNESNRELLTLILETPWEIYMCLLYVEIENYLAISKKHTSLTYKPLEVCLSENPELFQSLKEVRNSILHPLKILTLRETKPIFINAALQVASSPMFVLASIQNLIDNYLEWLQSVLDGCLAAELANGSDEETYEFLRRYPNMFASRLIDNRESELKSVTAQWLVQMRNSFESIALNVKPNYNLTRAQKTRLAQWEHALDALALPLPERPNPRSESNSQTPIPLPVQWIDWIPLPPTASQSSGKLQALPEYLQRGQSGFIDLLVSSLILANGCLITLFSDLAYSSPGTVHSEESIYLSLVEDIENAETDEAFRHIEMRTSPFFVALALLADPLKHYKQVTTSKPELKRGAIDELISDDRLATYNTFRNVAFHVPDDRTSSHKAFRALLEETSFLSSYLRIMNCLLLFYLPNTSAT